MEFTARINPVKNSKGSLRAFATLIVDNILAINDFRVLETNGELWVAFPSRPGKDSNGKDTYYPTVWALKDDEDAANELRDTIKATILEAYNNSAGSSKESSDGGRHKATQSRRRGRTPRW